MDMDKEISKLPSSEETSSVANLPTEKIRGICFKLQDSYTRYYKRQARVEKEVRLRALINSYVNRADKEALKHQPLESAIVNIIFPKLNVLPCIFKNNIFYVIAPNENRNYPFSIFSEQDIHTFYEIADNTLSSTFLNPTQKEFLAIIYWHQNKIINVESLCVPRLPAYSFQIPTLRILASAFTAAYGVALSHETSMGFSNQPIWNLRQMILASFTLLNLSPQSLTQNKYLIALFDVLKEHLSGGDYKSILKLLNSISNGNLASLNSFHDMIAIVFLGHLYADTVSSSKRMGSIIYCKNTRYIYDLIRNLFNTPFIRSIFMSSASMRLLVANNMQNRRPIYTDYVLDTLYNNISVPTALGLELNGCLVNISIQSSDRDIDTLKELVRKKVLHRKDDQVFKDTKYQSHMHYIHITDKLPTTIPKDIDVIELLGDPPKDYVFNENDSTCIIFLSLFNFFYPTKTFTDTHSPSRYTSDEDVVKKFKTYLFNDSTCAIPPECLDEIKRKYHDKDLSKSGYDTERIRLAKSIGIWDLDYTTSQDIEEAYNMWRSSDPDHIPEVKVIEIMRQLYSPLFYLKNNHAKSRLHPEEDEKNVKCFFGLALDPASLSTVIKARKEAAMQQQQALTEGSCTRYYESMICNFQEVYPKIRSELETLARMIAPDPPISPTQ